MPDKNKGPEGTDPNASQQPSQEQEQEQQPAQEQAPAQPPSDHKSLVDALKQAFAKEPVSTEVKVGMDETIEGGKYIRFGQLVNANGEPIDEKGNKLKKD